VDPTKSELDCVRKEIEKVQKSFEFFVIYPSNVQIISQQCRHVRMISSLNIITNNGAVVVIMQCATMDDTFRKEDSTSHTFECVPPNMKDDLRHIE
jgi:hypothetical protein